GDGELAYRQLVEPIAFAQRDWKTLARRRLESIAKPTRRPSIDMLSMDAAHLMLGGETAEFEKAINALKAYAASKPTAAWYCAEALLICGRQDDAIELLKKHRPSAAFSLLTARGQHAVALELAGIELPLGDEPIKPITKKNEDGSEVVDVYFSSRVAKVIYQLGEHDRAIEFFGTLAETPAKGDQRHRAHVAQQLMKLGREREAIGHAAIAIDATRKDPAKAQAELGRIMRSLFDTQATSAVACWKPLVALHAGETTAELLGRMRRVVLPKRAELEDDKGFETLRAGMDRAMTSSDEKLDDATRVAWLRALGKLCAVRGLNDAARDYYLQLAELESSGKTFVELADLYAKDKQWADAADWYKKAFDAKYQTTLTMFLQGHALAQAGREEQGASLMQLARLLPLADLRKRYELYNGLDDRGLRSLGRTERELVLRLGSMHDWHANNAAKEIGNDISKTRPLEAADHWQQSSLSVLRTNSSFLEESAYLRLPHIIHKVRARGLLAKGQREAAVAELWRSHEALPADIDLVLDFLPKLREAKLDKVADELFDKVYAVNEAITRDFPRSAHHHNSVAWLAARSERRTDEALEHAQTAVRLAPDSAAYLDTLAEVHFVRGDKQKAIELARRCIEMDPDRKIYRDQLKRFEQ
ncbi:MAG: hypothetical protein MI757_18005, partial [Pirellulales bacterium]|nr:hypothetical protein [Pirellulales bacterium]